MNVTLYGATGRAGNRILSELLSRGHQVKAVVRDPQKAKLPAGVKVEQGDLSNSDKIAEAARGSDAVISAYGPPMDKVELLLETTQNLILGLSKAGSSRLLMVGGAGSLEVAPGVQLVDAENFPAAWKPIALAHREALNLLLNSDIPWTYLSPAAFFEPGERTGKFRLGRNELLANEKGDSRISMEDYAIALVDELEKPAHIRQRFSIGY